MGNVSAKGRLHEAQRQSWTKAHRWYELSFYASSRHTTLVASCACQSFASWCKHLEAEWRQVARFRFQAAGVWPVFRPNWKDRPAWCTDEEIARHTYRREGIVRPDRYAGDDWFADMAAIDRGMTPDEFDEFARTQRMVTQ